jgi:tetraacyldisaccharide 4'-kinase
MQNIYIFTPIMGIKFLLFPFQWLYLLVTGIRHLMFTTGVRKRASFPLPVICIGNISTGGTGKTPHTKYLAKLLTDNGFRVAIILRGYKRKTKGFIHCNNNHTVSDIGDEAWEYVHRLGSDVNVFVDAKRKKGIKTIIQQFPDTDVVLMDDGYQHFAVKAGFYILLSDYLNPFYNDYVLPIGNLREPRRAKKRADVIVMSKTPKVFSPLIERDLMSQIKPGPGQKVVFSYFDYEKAIPVYSENQNSIELPKNLYSAFLLTGIANPYPLEEHLKRNCIELYTHAFADHHEFTVKEIENITKDFSGYLMKNKAIFTTEKDIARLLNADIKEKLVDLPLFCIPVSIGLHPNKEIDFDNLILDYVKQYSRNS